MPALRLVSSPDLRRRFGDEARKRAEERLLTPEQRASLELETIAELDASHERRGDAKAD
jgi:hypothetical protein